MRAGNTSEIKTINTKQELCSLAYNPDGIRVALGTDEKGILLFDLRKASEPCSSEILTESPVCVLQWSRNKLKHSAPVVEDEKDSVVASSSSRVKTGGSSASSSAQQRRADSNFNDDSSAAGTQVR